MYGWSGNIKLPVAYEESQQHSITTQERTMSNPEIVSLFVSFLKMISEDYQVVIGIDELDKMESEQDAKNSLDEIKSIFGLQRCFFLISFSENAIYNFERRGMPFRDVFDSSFDNITHIGNFKLKDTINLLQRRVIGKPLPLFYLTRCISRGTPRYVIRIFREIIRISRTFNTSKSTTTSQ